jgi:hypothetical protein
LRERAAKLRDRALGRRTALAVADVSNTLLLASFLLVLGVPHVLFVLGLDRIRRHQVVLVHGVDVDAEVLTHEPHAQRVREAPDLVRFAGHRAASACEYARARAR